MRSCIDVESQNTSAGTRLDILAEGNLACALSIKPLGQYASKEKSLVGHTTNLGGYCYLVGPNRSYGGMILQYDLCRLAPNVGCPTTHSTVQKK